MIDLLPYLQQLRLPAPDSHKGQNGKVMIIGGSALFHAASKWSLDIASAFVDMVFYSSIPDNNQAVLIAKQHFWNGIVIPRTAIEDYIQEADCILIGPGMERQKQETEQDELLSSMIRQEFAADTSFSAPTTQSTYARPTPTEWDHDTGKVTNYLLSTYPQKKWVIDAGALQMVDARLLTPSMIITPHHGEWQGLVDRSRGAQAQEALNQVTAVIKGPVDTIRFQGQTLSIDGGNAGMTKGGTGDVLAGCIAGLYARHSAEVAAVIGSAITKKAGDSLWQQVGPNFTASDLAAEIPKVLWKEWQHALKLA